jgi:hypothetical protein
MLNLIYTSTFNNKMFTIKHLFFKRILKINILFVFSWFVPFKASYIVKVIDFHSFWSFHREVILVVQWWSNFHLRRQIVDTSSRSSKTGKKTNWGSSLKDGIFDLISHFFKLQTPQSKKLLLHENKERKWTTVKPELTTICL